MVLIIENQLDLFIETINRNQLIVYILENAEKENFPQPDVKEASKLNLGKKKEKIVDLRKDTINEKA